MNKRFTGLQYNINIQGTFLMHMSLANCIKQLKGFAKDKV